ncbi:RNB-domain-containing protein [Neocallimastix sp. 'constans']
MKNDRDIPYFEIKFDNIDKKVLSINNFRNNPNNFRNKRYKAKILEWNSKFKNPLGLLTECIKGNDDDDDSNRNGQKLKNKLSIDNEEPLKYSKSESTTFYETYLSIEKVKKGIENNTLFKGKLIFGDDYKSDNSYVLLNNSEDKIYIKSDVFRNRGLDGDEVIVEPFRNDNKEGKIVYIENPSYKDKKIYGKMLYEVEKSGSSLFFYLCPRDKKLPRIEIPRKLIPKEILSITDFLSNQNKYKYLYNFVSQIQHWNEDEKLPIGKLIENNNSEDLESIDVSKIIEEVISRNYNDPFSILKIKLRVNENSNNDYFEKYYPIELVKYGIKNGYLFEGKVEILKNKNSDCSVILNDTNEKIIIENKKDRNRGMHGDRVVVEIIDSTSKDKTGKIVYLDFKTSVYNDMKIKGKIKYSPERRIVLFYPDDKRIPLIDIPVSNIPRSVLTLNNYNEETDGNSYYNAKIIKYENQSWNPLGELIEKIDKIKNDNCNDYYEKYFSEEEVEKGLNNKTLFEGLIRVSSKNGNNSYVTVVGLEKDIRINSVKLRNRALDNDIVIVKLLEGEELKSSESAIKQKKEENKLKDKKMFEKFATKGVKLTDYIEEESYPLGKVVYVKKSKAKSIDIVGKFKFNSERNYANEEKFIFHPNDKGIPLIDIFAEDIDPQIFDINDFINNSEKYNDTLFIARITKWSEMRCYPKGKIVSKLTDEHTLESRTNIILKTYNIDDSYFNDLITKEIPSGDWQIPEEEIKNRLDLREECIFTIDPATAKDLDDALSCKRLDDGNYEIGIHIADVSYFVTPDSNMDSEAFKRGTSTYLVQKVIPMLPKVLCENLCSLNAGTSRLAFSIIIKMDKDGHVLESKAAKTVICSCVKLAYDHAQRVIDNNGEWPKENADIEIKNPYHTYTSEDVCNTINNLYRLSHILKEERYANGAVSLDRKELWLELNEDLPIDCGIYEVQEANSLVEEFMLLANTTVANILYRKYSNESLLRCHEAPSPENVKRHLKLIEMTKKIVIDVSNSKAFHDSLLSIQRAGSIYSDVALSRCVKFMKRAKYICSSADHPESLFHYGLHIPFYTHFTSPIRRYPDIIVHRQLKALLDEKPSPYDSKKIREIAKQSNDTNTNSSKAQDDSYNLYLVYLLNEYVEKTQKDYIIEDALVTGFDNYNIECYIPKFAYEDKMSINQLYEKGIIKSVEIFKPATLNSNEEVNTDSKNTEEVSFNIFWNNDVNMDNILKKFNTEVSDKSEDPHQELYFENIIKNNSSLDFFNIIESDDEDFDSDDALEKYVEAVEAATAYDDEFNDVSDEDFDSDDAIEKYVEAVEAAAAAYDNEFNDGSDEDFDSDDALEKYVEAVEAAAAYDNKFNDENNRKIITKKFDNNKERLTDCPKQNFKIFSSFKVMIIPNFDKMKINILVAPPDVTEHDISNECYHSHLITKESESDAIIYEVEGSFD